MHTFWVFRRITLVWVDESGVVLKIQKQVSPFRIYYCSEAYGVIEYDHIPSVQIGDRLRLPRKQKQNNIGVDDSGQALVELALILPLILLLVFGFLYLSLSISAMQRLQYVVNSAATTGSMTNNDLKVTGIIEEFYTPGEVSVSIENKDDQSESTINSNDRRYNDIITVQLQYDFPISIPYIEIASIPLRAVATARILCQEDNPPYTCE